MWGGGGSSDKVHELKELVRCVWGGNFMCVPGVCGGVTGIYIRRTFPIRRKVWGRMVLT